MNKLQKNEAHKKRFDYCVFKLVVKGNCPVCGREIDGDNIFLCKECQKKQKSWNHGRRLAQND